MKISPAIGRHTPFPFTVRETLATMTFRLAEFSVPAVYTDFGRAITQVITATAVFVRTAWLPEAHCFRQTFPRISAGKIIY